MASWRFGLFMPIVSLATSLFVTYLIKPKLEFWSPEHWISLTICAGLATLVLAYCVAYSLCLCYIRFCRKADLLPVLRKRWHGVLSAPTAHLPVTNYLDRVASLQIRVAMPSVLQDVVKELSAAEKAASASLQQTIDRYAAENRLGAFVKTAGNCWKSTTPVAACSARLIDDPVHGCITLDSTLATVIAQPIVQRLARIRQLSFSYSHFPSATHSRLSHVLGVAHNVEAAVTGVFLRGVYYENGNPDPVKLSEALFSDQGRLIQRAKLLAVLHDLGHGPFGHALDHYVGYINAHQTTPNPDKVYSRLYVDRHLAPVLRSLGFDPEELVNILNPEERSELTGFDAFIGDLIDSSMDMDRMDYLMRDAHMTGLSMGFTNADALIQCVRPVRLGEAYLLAYHVDGIGYMEHLLYAREAMYRGCYEHPRKRAMERIFERLVREIVHDDAEFLDDLYCLTDEDVLCVLRLVEPKSVTAKQLLEQLVNDSDYMVVHDVQADSRGMSDEARAWVRNAAKGRGKPSYVDRPAEWEDAIARASVGPNRSAEIQVIVASPGAYEQKFNAATILLNEDGVYRTKPFFEVASGVKDVLAAMNKARARIKVMCRLDMSRSDREKVKKACLEVLGS